jgi:SAM-dependent methyltransferase
MIIEEKQCRICSGTLTTVLDLGEIYPSAFIKDDDELPKKAPLVLARCNKCALVQLNHTIDLDQMYRQYWYTSSLNKSMVASLKDVADDIQYFYSLYEGDIILDIGCNDGTLFKFFPDYCYKIGFDPAFNLEEEATKNCDLFINNYFRSDLLLDRLRKTKQKAKVITSIAMFYDLPDPHTFIENVIDVMADDGVWVIQFTDLTSMFKATAFDNICHEHLEYYTLEVLNSLMNEHSLEIFKVKYNEVNGGSIRVFVRKDFSSGKLGLYKVVKESIDAERAYFERLKDPFEVFAHKIELNKIATKNWLDTSKELGLKTYVLGASTKGNTLLQVWGLDYTDFPYALEVNEEKFGLNTVGSHIHIIPEEGGLALKPDQLFVLPWHFISNLKSNLSEYMDNGGKLITPLPNFSMHYKKGDFQWILQQRILVQ